MTEFYPSSRPKAHDKPEPWIERRSLVMVRDGLGYEVAQVLVTGTPDEALRQIHDHYQYLVSLGASPWHGPLSVECEGERMLVGTVA